MQTPGIGASNATSAAGSNQALGDIDMSQFLNLMIAELQNQDPLNPMSNSEMMQQISQIRSIDSTTKLTDTLDAVLLGQNLANASSLIGKEVRALTDGGGYVTGAVDRVSIVDGVAKVHIGDSQIKLENIAEIKSA